jgi:hypothetical protein
MGAGPWRATLEDLRRRFAAAADPPLYVVRLESPGHADAFAPVRHWAGRPIVAVHGPGGPGEPRGERPCYVFLGDGADSHAEFCALARQAAAALAGPIDVGDGAWYPPELVPHVLDIAERDAHVHRWLVEVFQAAAAGGGIHKDTPIPGATTLSIDVFRASAITCAKLLAGPPPDPIEATLELERLRRKPRARELIRRLRDHGNRADPRDLAREIYGKVSPQSLETLRQLCHRTRGYLWELRAPIRLEMGREIEIIIIDRDIDPTPRA